MNVNWIHKQTEMNIAQFDHAMETHYPESQEYMRDAQAHISRLCEQCNYLDAVKIIDWESCLGADASVLDLGCGGGWLTAYLSAFDYVNNIYAVDSSHYFISEMLPQVVELMGGKLDKVKPVEGFFTPLLFQDGLLDAVVASSALHHADNLEGVLTEIRRVLKKDGVLIILNETPSTRYRHVYSLSKAFVRMFLNTLFKKYKSTSPYISSSGYLYDPLLGDKDYPAWYWSEAIRQSGFKLVETVDSGLPTVKGVPGAHLTHFICRAI